MISALKASIVAVRFGTVVRDGTGCGASRDINSQWSDLACQNIGHVNWAPAISVDIEGRHYTKDIGTFKVDTVRFRIQFKGNIVNLGAFCLIFLVVTLSN